MLGRATLLFFVLSFVLSAGCTRSIADSGATCELNSDCRAPLVCAASLCRPQCREDRDCAAGATCVAYGDTRVCVPPAMPTPCAFASECGAGRTCVAGTCRAMCATDADCSGGTCMDGACSTAVPTAVDAGVADGSRCATTCGARCVDLENDAEHCGRCDNACAAGDVCTAGTCMTCPAGAGCRAANDDCLGAELVPLIGARTTIRAPDPALLTDSPTSCSAESDSFYRFHLDTRAIVTAVAEAGGADRAIGFVDAACHSAGADCGTMCGADSVVTEVLDVGDHALVVEASRSLPGSFSVVIEVVPIGPDAVVEPIDFSIAAPITTVLVAGAPLPGAACPAAGPAHAWYFVECDSGRITFTASTCGSTPDTVVASQSTNPAYSTCNDTDASCAPGATVAVNFVDDPGLHVITVAGKTPADVGPVTLTITAP